MDAEAQGSEHSQQQKWKESLFSADLYSKINHQTKVNPQITFHNNHLHILLVNLLNKKMQQFSSLFTWFNTSVRTLDAAYSTSKSI